MVDVKKCTVQNCIEFLRIEGMPEYINESLQSAQHSLFMEMNKNYPSIETIQKSIVDYLDQCQINSIQKVWLAFGRGTDSLLSTCEYILEYGLTAFISRND